MIPEELLDRAARGIVEELRDLVREIVREEVAAALPEQPQREWMPIEEAAVKLGKSVPATRARIKRGNLDGEKRGGRWLVKVESVRRAGGAV